MIAARMCQSAKPPMRVLILCLMFGQTLADPSTEEGRRFLEVKDAIWSASVHSREKFDTSRLPPGLAKLLAGYYWGERGLPPFISGHRVDLNRDGHDEYCIVTIHGGSGGPAWLICSPHRGSWRVVCDMQGSLHLLPRGKGEVWPRIISISRGGAESYGKRTWRYSGREYVVAETVHHDELAILRAKARP